MGNRAAHRAPIEKRLVGGDSVGTGTPCLQAILKNYRFLIIPDQNAAVAAYQRTNKLM